jgi:hypothetical protein
MDDMTTIKHKRPPISQVTQIREKAKQLRASHLRNLRNLRINYFAGPRANGDGLRTCSCTGRDASNSAALAPRADVVWAKKARSVSGTHS